MKSREFKVRCGEERKRHSSILVKIIQLIKKIDLHDTCNFNHSTNDRTFLVQKKHVFFIIKNMDSIVELSHAHQLMP